jgi:hypothetical protein
MAGFATDSRGDAQDCGLQFLVQLVANGSVEAAGIDFQPPMHDPGRFWTILRKTIPPSVPSSFVRGEGGRAAFAASPRYALSPAPSMPAPNGWDVAKEVRRVRGDNPPPLMIAISGQYTRGRTESWPRTGAARADREGATHVTTE